MLRIYVHLKNFLKFYFFLAFCLILYLVIKLNFSSILCIINCLNIHKLNDFKVKDRKICLVYKSFIIKVIILYKAISYI